MILSNPIKKDSLVQNAHHSYWIESVQQSLTRKPLTNDIETDIVIVGAGIAGISTAYCLTQQGRKVTVIEDGNIAGGVTGHTTAHLSTALDDGYYQIEKNFGEANTKLIAESHKKAIDFIEQTIIKENIYCDFKRVPGYLFLHPSDNYKSLKKEFETAKRAGVDVQELNYIPGMQVEKECICFAQQAQIHPLKYLMGLCSRIEKNGNEIFTQTHVSEIGDKEIKTKSGFKIKANHIVIATNAPINNMFTIPLRQVAYRSYVIAARIKKNILSPTFWWDTGNQNEESAPYHYVRLQEYSNEYDLLLCGGEDHPVGKTPVGENKYTLLESWTREHFPIEEVILKWSGEIFMPIDSIAFIGRYPRHRKNSYIITGDSGSGFTYGTIAGELISDLIVGRENKFSKIYDPHRFVIKTSGGVFKILSNTVKALAKKWFYSAEALLPEKGKGKVVRIDGEKYGAFRDDNGRLHIVSAKCTHLGCLLAWNRYEKSWDCPCHGSRFTYDGKVINGPANSDLPPYKKNNKNIIQ